MFSRGTEWSVFGGVALLAVGRLASLERFGGPGRVVGKILMASGGLVLALPLFRKPSPPGGLEPRLWSRYAPSRWNRIVRILFGVVMLGLVAGMIVALVSGDG